MSAAAVQLEWARVVLHAMRQAGVTDVVVSPGSRSTPFVLAALDAPREASEPGAGRSREAGGFNLHSIIDERSAAFFALGQARITGRPSVCLATSGTAGAHYLPAAIEANASHTPLILFTADRPLELVGAGALQTIDQPRMFGHHTRAFFELGGPDPAGGALALRAAARTATQVVLAATHPEPGAVHVNARARKPLEPTLEERAAAGRVVPPRATRVVPPRLVPPESVMRDLAARLLRSERGLITVGPGAARHPRGARAIADLARRTGIPLYAEATSGLRFIAEEQLRGVTLLDPAEPLLRARSFRRELTPDLVLSFGPTPTSTAFAELAAAERVVVAPHGWNDPTSSASELILAEVVESAELLLSLLGGHHPARRSTWAEWIGRASGIARAVVEQELARAGFSEGLVVREAVARAPAGSVLAVGNGLAIRHLDVFAPPAAAALRVVCQRGASGIDGLISGAAGVASTGEISVTAITGDVSMLHDLGGLAAARTIEAPLVFVVLANDGGRIFEQLPIGATGPCRDDLAYWTTPHGYAFKGAAEMFAIPYTSVADRGSLLTALRFAHQTRGPSIIEARVEPHGAKASLDDIDAALAQRLEGEPR